ncbi:MAG: TlpA disulfide reductase family protein [Bacteroidota bacterium]|nr:TlpA disulfide reductase family protein [Bacteroidota bacterium]
MNRIIQKIKDHYKKKSLFNILSDLLFYGIIILLLIPSTRMTLVTFVKKATLIAPLKINAPDNSKLKDSDYRWYVQSKNGENIDLEQFKGELIFLNFWATWCPPCVAEMPSIQSLYEEYGDKIRFIIVSRESPEVIQEFVKKNKYTFPVYSQSASEPAIFKSQSIPTSYLISPSGNIILKKKGAAKWDSKKIKELINTNLE